MIKFGNIAAGGSERSVERAQRRAAKSAEEQARPWDQDGVAEGQAALESPGHQRDGQSEQAASGRPQKAQDILPAIFGTFLMSIYNV